MKRLLLVILLLVAPIGASAQLCPLKLPFRINISIAGRYANYQTSDDTTRKNSHDTSGTTHSYQLTIDTTSSTSRFGYVDGLLDFSDSIAPSSDWQQVFEAKIQFNSKGDSITTSVFRFYGYGFRCCNYEDWNLWSVTSENLKVNSDSIFALPSQSVQGLVDSWHEVYHNDVGPHFHEYLSGSSLLAGAATISGSTTAKSSVTSGTHPRGIVAASIFGSIKCDFASCQSSRHLEIFTPLGVRVAAHPVGKGETSATLPHLPAGLYFIRMEGAFAKIVLPE